MLEVWDYVVGCSCVVGCCFDLVFYGDDDTHFSVRYNIIIIVRKNLTFKYYRFTCYYFNILYMIFVLCLNRTIDIISMYVI